WSKRGRTRLLRGRRWQSALGTAAADIGQRKSLQLAPRTRSRRRRDSMQSRGRRGVHVVEAHDRNDKAVELRRDGGVRRVGKRHAVGNERRGKSALGGLGVARGLNRARDRID